MKKSRTKLLAAALSLSMLPLPSLPVMAQEEAVSSQSEEASRYEIYPIPHSTEYPESNSEFTVSSVNVVYESGIDEVTKNYLSEILEQNGLSATESNAIAEGRTNILVGVSNSDGVADQWFEANETLSSDLFGKTDAYALDVRSSGSTQVVAVLGRDSDSAFYGLSTLEMMFSSFEGNKLVDVSIEDYADKELRGFIEGFYGGFTYEGRESQIRFLRKVKGNMYVFASKTDPYHGGSNWRNLYPEEELSQIKHLVDVAKECKVRYAWSFHSGKSQFLSGCSSDPTSSTYSEYQDRLQSLFAKFQQLYDIGVRDFHILNDDYNSGSYADVSLFLNDVNAWLKAKGDCGPLVFCPQNYTINWNGGAASTEMPVHKEKLDKDILFYWTGSQVNCPIIQSDVDWLYSRTGNEVVNWINYPCSEHDKAGIYLGSIDNYFHNADNLQHTRGLMSNPVNYPEANKVAYFQLMSWLWNTQNYSASADQVWRSSFRYIEPEIADSYEVVARHISNCPDSSRYAQGFPESEDLKASLEAAQTRLLAGNADLNDPDIKAVVDEMTLVKSSIADMKANGSAELLRDLTPWLNSLDGVSGAILEGAAAAESLEEGDLSATWAHLSKASSQLALWNAYPTPEFPEKIAKAGSKRLQPFASRLISYLSAKFMPMLDPSCVIPTVYTSLPENNNTAKMIDGDETTYASWHQDQVAGDYYGLDFGRAIDIHDVEIIQGQNDTHHDRFHESTLEYSIDGNTWTAIEENINASRIVRDNLNIKARYIRLRVTGFTDPDQPSKNKFWTEVREFTVNKAENAPLKIWSDQENTAAAAQVTKADSTITLGFTGDFVLEAGKSIGFQLDDPIFAGTVSTSQVPEGIAAEYSLDGSTWSSDPVAPRKTIRFARLRNTADAAKTLSAQSTLAVTQTTGAAPTVTTDLPIKSSGGGSWANLVDGNLTTFGWSGVNQAAGQEIMVDLGRELPCYSLAVYMDEQRPRLYHGTFSVSADGQNWKDVMTVDAANDRTSIDGARRWQREEYDGSRVRYIRLQITDSAKEEASEGQAYLKLYEIRLNDAPIPVDAPSLFSGTGDNMDAAADSNMATAFEATPGQAGSLEYIVPKNNDKRVITIVQDAERLSGAKVSIMKEGSSEWTDLGTLDEPVSNLSVDGDEAVQKIRVSWTADQPAPKIYEMMMTDPQDADSPIQSVVNPEKITVAQGTAQSEVGFPAKVTVVLADGTTRSVDVAWEISALNLSQPGTYTLEGELNVDEAMNPNDLKASLTVQVTASAAAVENLALHKTAVGSGNEVSDGTWTPDLVTDGDKTSDSSRWSSAKMKTGTSADQTQTEQWLTIDLGEGTNEIHSVVTTFFKKVYATDYDIQVSDDGETWQTVKAHAGVPASTTTEHPVDTIEFDTPVTGRYVKFVYHAINHNAGGNSLSIREIEIYGVHSSQETPAPAAVDRSLLKTALDKAAEIQTGEYALSDAQKTEWTEACSNAQAVYDLESADQAAVNAAAESLGDHLLALRLSPSADKLAQLAD